MKHIEAPLLLADSPHATRRSRAAVVAFFTGAVLALAGCASDGDETGTADGPGTTPSEAGATFDTVAEGKLTVGSQAGMVDIEFQGETDDTMQGLLADLAREVGQRLDLEVVYTTSQFTTLIPGLEANRWDMASGLMTIVPAREEVVDFVPVKVYATTVLMKAGETQGWKGIEDACGATISMTAGAAGYPEVIQAASDDCEANGQEPITQLELDSTPNGIAQVDNGRADGFAGSMVRSLATMRENPGQYELLGGPAARLTVAQTGWAFNKDNDELREAVRDALASMIEDGTYQRILDQWVVPEVDLALTVDDVMNYEPVAP